MSSRTLPGQLYTPETRRVRRLPESLVDADLYGIEPEFLGFGTAHTEPTKIRSMTTERLQDRRAFRLVESALSANRRFEERVTWIDAERSSRYEVSTLLTVAPFSRQKRGRSAQELNDAVLDL
jgi:hypothetical protein